MRIVELLNEELVSNCRMVGSSLGVEEMQRRIQAWKHAFDSDDQGILRTLITLTWNFAAFSTVIELVKSAPDGERGGKQLNAMVLDLLANSYWGSMVMAVRRLVDRFPLAGARGVCSLRAIVNDARASRQGLTRRVYVEAIAGLEYDVETLKARHWEYLLAQPSGYVNIPRELAYEPSEQRHAEFDWLSGVESQNRKADDIIRIEIFDGLDARLARLDTIADHGSIYFAHAATEASRQGRGLTSWNHDEAKEALREMAQVAELIGRWFCFTGIGDLLPTAQYDQFEYLDRPLLSGNQDGLQEAWDNFGREVSGWPFIENEEL